MANMEHCRFSNTLDDLQDCYDHMDADDELSAVEAEARKNLIRLCIKIKTIWHDDVD
jgi:hypothetical protein